MLSKFRRVRGEKGFTLIELLIVIAIIGILSAIAIPQFSAYKNRAYQSDVKAHLHNLFLACKAYWADKGPTTACAPTSTGVANATYGYATSVDIGYTTPNTTEANFNVSAVHTDDASSTSYSIDANGVITP